MFAPLFYPYYLGLKWMGMLTDAPKAEPVQPPVAPPVSNVTHLPKVVARPKAARAAPSPTKTHPKRAKKALKRKK
jgi:hypothetical protein